MNTEQVRDNVLLCRVGVKPEFLQELLGAITFMPDNQRFIIKARFGLLDGQFRSMSSTQKIADLSRQRVDQIEKRAVEMLRETFKGRGALKEIGRVRINKHNITWGRESVSRADLG